jgi:hypothetical protein
LFPKLFFGFARLGFGNPRGARGVDGEARLPKMRSRRDELERIAVSLRGGGRRRSRCARCGCFGCQGGAGDFRLGERVLPLPLWAFEISGQWTGGHVRTEMVSISGCCWLCVSSPPIRGNSTRRHTVRLKWACCVVVSAWLDGKIHLF